MATIKAKVNINVEVLLVKVDSSQIEAVGHEAKSLIVKFNKGGVYTYEPVKFSTFQDLLKAESIGKFFNTNIKNNAKITCTKQEV